MYIGYLVSFLYLFLVCFKDFFLLTFHLVYIYSTTTLPIRRIIRSQAQYSSNILLEHLQFVLENLNRNITKSFSNRPIQQALPG